VWRFLKVIASLLFSSAVSAIAVALISASPGVVTIAFWIALAHAIILGGPLIVIFWWKRWINSFTATVAGFGVGAIGVAIFTWPLRHQDLQSSAWSNGIQTMVDGAPTFAGWLQYLYGVGTFAAFGALGGFAFWLWLSSTVLENRIL
jgi:hypothetical protein